MSNLLTSNITQMGIVSFTYDPASIANITVTEDTIKIPGLQVGDVVFAQRVAHSAGIGITDCRVSAKDTLSISWVNPTAAPVNAASASYLLFWARSDSVRGSVTP